MRLGQIPEGASIAQVAAYRRAILTGAIPGTMTFQAYMARLAPGSISATAETRRATITRTPLPPTQGPPFTQLPAQYLREGAAAAGEAVKKGLQTGTAILVLGAAAVLGFLFWRSR